MKRELWPLQMIMGVGGVLNAGLELTFGGQTSQGLLLMVGIMFVVEAWGHSKDGKNGR